MKNATALLASGILLVGLAAAPALAITVDGTAEAGYGPAVSTQAVQTQFGNATIGQVDYADGSEIDEAYGIISGGTLYLTLTGNLESNFNKLEVFLDTKAGGQGTLRGDNPNVDFDGLNRMSGLTFDTGMEPDYWLSVTGGGGPYALYANFAELLTGGGGAGGYLGTTGAASNGVLSGGTNPNNIQVTIDNHNTAGVPSGCDAASGAGVATGVEFAIPLAAIGNPTDCVQVTVAVNGGSHDFLSNQLLGPLSPSQCNLGEPHTTDLRQYSGNQYFSVCPGTVATQPESWSNVKALFR